MVPEMRVGNLCGLPPTKPHTCHKNAGTSFASRKKAPAAAAKTSTKLIHVIKSKERHFCRNKCACGSRDDQANEDEDEDEAEDEDEDY